MDNVRNIELISYDVDLLKISSASQLRQLNSLHDVTLSIKSSVDMINLQLSNMKEDKRDKKTKLWYPIICSISCSLIVAVSVILMMVK